MSASATVAVAVDNDGLVDKLKAANYITTPLLERVFRAVDRGDYFTSENREQAYREKAWKKGNLHLSAPSIYAKVMEGLQLSPGHSFLNLGSGTGYLSTMAGLIVGPYGVNHGVELHADVLKYSFERLEEFKKNSPGADAFNFCDPQFVQGNCLCLPPDVRLYDRVYCGASCPESREQYMKALIKPGGVLVMPINNQLVKMTRSGLVTWETVSLAPVYFSSLVMPDTEHPPPTVTMPPSRPTLTDRGGTCPGAPLLQAQMIAPQVDKQKIPHLNITTTNPGGLQEAMSCDVCSEVYERTLKTPLVLPCGHTFCQTCLVAIKKRGRFSCPTCRAAHNNMQVEALTVNFSLLNFLPFCATFTYDKCTTHGDDLRYWCCTCDLPLCGLCLYSGHPQGHTVKLAQSYVEEKKLELTEKIKLFFGNINDKEEELKGCFSDLDASMIKLFQKHIYLQEKLVALTDLLNNTQKASDITSIKYFEKAVKDIQCMENAPSGMDVSKEKAKDSGAAVAKAAKQSSEPCQEQPPQDQNLAQTQRAIIDFRQGRMLLHSLATPASKGLSLQVPSEVFLELSVGDQCLGHVFISLWCHLRRAQQMLALCMGTMGPCLLDTKASDKNNGILRFRYVVDGNNKTRNQPLLTNLEWGGPHTALQTEGCITAVDFGGDRGNSVGFGICQQAANVNLHAPFGRVIAGQEVVEAACQYNPITEVTITRSGLVLPGLSIKSIVPHKPVG